MIQNFDNIIIGAGPAGLQCGYYFKKNDINYTIIERSDQSGSFFSKYPLSGNLISINKKYTGSDNVDFNMRHDWNSLLNDENIKFTDYSDDYYPKNESLVEYLNDFAVKSELNIYYNKNVFKIIKKHEKYYITIQNSDDIFICKNLIISTGLSLKNVPLWDINVKDKIKHYSDYNCDEMEKLKKECINKNVLLIGNGNSSFELANILNNNIASKILICGRSHQTYAMNTHYSGNIRSVYLPFLDTFFLKSLNTIDSVSKNITIDQFNSGEPYKLSYYDENNDMRYISPGNENFDKIIFCTGWKFDTSIFDFDLNMTCFEKYPEINEKYESTNNKNLFFIGTLMHSHDYKKSSGGFIHGFRYLIRLFVHLNFNIPLNCKIYNFYTHIHSEILANKIIERINTSSDIYQMFGVLSDVFYYNISKKEILYCENIQSEYNIGYYKDKIILFSLTLDYGHRETDMAILGIKLSSLGNESASTFLHPIIKIYQIENEEKILLDIVHFDEDLFAKFLSKSMYYDKLVRLLNSYINYQL